MRKAAMLVCSALLILQVAGESYEVDAANILVAHGVLVRESAVGDGWSLKPGSSLTFRGHAITEVELAVAAQDSSAYEPYDGKEVELVGQVDRVSQGTAVVRDIYTIGLSSLPMPSLLRRLVNQPPPASALSPANRTAYRHAYYLFMASAPQGCEACYVPLLISQQSLEEIAQGKQSKLCVLIYTYERDSLWEIKGATPVAPLMVETAPRIVHLIGTSYRFQEISPREVVKLLENPMGTIPISRLVIPNKDVPGASLAELIQDFRSLEP